MTNYQCKKLDPLVTGDIGSFCVECLQDTNFRDAEGNQTFRFVNRIPADRDVYNEEGEVIGTEKVGFVQIVIGWNVIVAMKRFIVTKTAHLTMCTKIMNQQSFLMVHTESTTNV